VGIIDHWCAMTQSAEDKNDAVEASPSTPDTSEDLDVFVKELMDNSKLLSPHSLIVCNLFACDK